MGQPVDVIIIGAGVIGAATAVELSRAGYRTLNIDSHPSAGYGPTSNSCAIVRVHYSSLESVKMAHEALSYWRTWPAYLQAEDAGEVARLIECGTVLLKGGSKHHEKVLAHYRSLGVEFEDWDTETLRSRLPYLDTSSFWPPTRPADDPTFFEATGELAGAVYTPSSGYVNDPALAARNLQHAAQATGARFLFRRTVTGLIQAEGRVAGVELDNRERIDARVVVNVAGPHSFLVNRMAGIEDGMRVKTRALRHEVHCLPAPAGIDFERDGFHVSDGDSAIYFRPEVGNCILIGSEDPPCDPQVWVEDPSSFDRRVTRDQWEAQVYRCARRMPSLVIPHEPRGVVDLYDVSDDWIPIYDKSDLPGFYMAVGTSGNQFKNAPVVGHLMAELITACEHGHDHDDEPLKIRTRFTGTTLDVGHYSRLREPDPNSSFSVLG
jgi:sarcosine oxidase subunit beta